MNVQTSADLLRQTIKYLTPLSDEPTDDVGVLILNLEESARQHDAVASVLALVRKGIRKGNIKDQTITRPTADGTGLDLIPLSEMIDAALCAAPSRIVAGG